MFDDDDADADDDDDDDDNLNNKLKLKNNVRNRCDPGTGISLLAARCRHLSIFRILLLTT